MIKSTLLLCFLLLCFHGISQPSNDDCANAIELCPNLILSGTTADATNEPASDNISCFLAEATVWYYFTTCDTGDVSVDVTNLVFDPDPTFGQSIDVSFYRVTTACDVSTATQYGFCAAGSTDLSSTNIITLDSAVTYYIQINGRLTGAGVTAPAACEFDIAISGNAVDKPIPTVTIADANTDLCLGDAGAVPETITDCSGTLNYEWLYNDVSIATSTTNDFDKSVLTESGSLELVVSCGDICPQRDTSNTIDYTVTIISADAGPDKFISLGNQVTIDGDGDGTPLWSPSTSVTNPNIFQPVANPEVTTMFFLTVTEGACVKTDSMTVHVGELITIYSSFTPNGDNINDKWIISNSSSFPDMEVVVYDRSGQVVFSTVNYSTPEKWWDGTLKNDGKELPSSTYFYVIDLKEGDDSIFKGPVTIIR